MLQYDFENRFSSHDCLTHPWITRKQNKSYDEVQIPNNIAEVKIQDISSQNLNLTFRWLHTFFLTFAIIPRNFLVRCSLSILLFKFNFNHPMVFQESTLIQYLEQLHLEDGDKDLTGHSTNPPPSSSLQTSSDDILSSDQRLVGDHMLDVADSRSRSGSFMKSCKQQWERGTWIQFVCVIVICSWVGYHDNYNILFIYYSVIRNVSVDRWHMVCSAQKFLFGIDVVWL